MVVILSDHDRIMNANPVVVKRSESGRLYREDEVTDSPSLLWAAAPGERQEDRSG
jgi:hypothetical protein